MPIKKRWSNLDNVEQAPEKPGVYEMGDKDGNIVYIGQSNDVHRRLQEHTSPKPPKGVKSIRFQRVTNPHSKERQMLRAFERNTGRLPKLNKQSP